MVTATSDVTAVSGRLDPDACQRALGARDARFDGLFFVGITTTRVYCRPVCPARVSYPERRRFFDTPAAAEGAGYRPCLRCRPELAPGRALIDAVPRLAHVAAHRIAAGALNGRSVADLAQDLGVSERHLRRALEREVGVSPLELAQTHRLLLAKRLLADTALSVTRVAYASGFQSLRRFNAVFSERYRMPPSALRRARRTSGSALGRGASRTTAASGTSDAPTHELLRLTLAYRAPLAWDVLRGMLSQTAMPGVEVVDEHGYRRTVRLGGRTGVVFVGASVPNVRGPRRSADTQLAVDVSPALLPELMPLLARLRHLFDLDAEPKIIDDHLGQSGLARHVAGTPGVRLPGAFNGFEVALASLLTVGLRANGQAAMRRIVVELGEPVETPVGSLTHLTPSAERVASAGAETLVAMGVTATRAAGIAAVARMIADGTLRLEPGSDVNATHHALAEVHGVGERLATAIVARTLQWPDAFSPSDRALQRAAGTTSARDLGRVAEAWRPWRAYAALHLRL